MGKKTRALTTAAALTAGAVVGGTTATVRQLRTRLTWHIAQIVTQTYRGDPLVWAIASAGWQQHETTIDPMADGIAILKCFVEGVAYNVYVQLDTNGQLLPCMIQTAHNRCGYMIPPDQTTHLTNKQRIIEYIQQQRRNGELS